MVEVRFDLVFQGGSTEKQVIDFYDVAYALLGFERSLALTVHAVLNDEVITQAPALRGAKIFALPPESGSWKLTAAVVTGVGAGVYALGTAPKDTPLGNVIASAYDYVVHENLGFHVDYDSTLGKQIEGLRASDKNLKLPDQNRLDSVVEKTSKAIEAIHRPIVNSKSAKRAELKLSFLDKPTTIKLNEETYDYISRSSVSDSSVQYEGKISSYNINTFKGRIFLARYKRSLPFELTESARVDRVISLVTRSLYRSANRNAGDPQLRIKAPEVLSRSGQLKKLLIVELTE